MGDLEITLTDEQVRSFQDNGCLAIEQITTSEEIEWLKGAYDRIFADRLGEAEGRFFDLGGKRGHDGPDVLPQVLLPEEQMPELLDTIYQRNALRLGAQLLGLDPSDVRAGGHMILKPPRYGRETPWHQDEAYWDPAYDHTGLSVWMPLDDASVESGCMQFVPGTHRYEVQAHRHIDDDSNVHGLMLEEDEAPEGAVACPIPAGGATFHHCRILHYAGPNTTDHPRRAYITVLSAQPVKRETRAERPWLDKRHDVRNHEEA